MQEELIKALEVLIENNVDMIIVEYFFYIQEMEWAIELCKKVLHRHSIRPNLLSVQQADRSDNGDRS